MAERVCANEDTPHRHRIVAERVLRVCGNQGTPHGHRYHVRTRAKMISVVKTTAVYRLAVYELRVSANTNADPNLLFVFLIRKDSKFLDGF